MDETKKWSAGVKKRIIGTLAAAACTVLMATPAQAEPNWPSWPGEVKTSDGMGYGYFAYDGDYIGANDFKFDGASTVTRWETDYGRSGECKDTNGAQNGVTACNYDMAESGYVRVKVCHRDYSNDIGWINCSSWSQWLSIRDGVPR
ncbi:hypothetical protein ACWDZ6_09555 [Streptomyces sp. NPDC002926]